MERKQILTTLLALIMLLSVITITYAYFVVGPQVQNQTAQVEAGTMSLTFSDNDNGIGGVLNFGESITKKFTIENTGTLDAYAKISWLNIVNTYSDGSLIYTLESLRLSWTFLKTQEAVETSQSNDKYENCSHRMNTKSTRKATDFSHKWEKSLRHGKKHSALTGQS